MIARNLLSLTLTNIHALDEVNRVILKLNVPTKREKTSRSMRRKENQKELTMMTHQAPHQVKMKKSICVLWQGEKIIQVV